MSFTETTTTSWFARLKGALMRILVGMVLVIATTVLLFWNEGRAIKTYRALVEGAGLVVSVDAGTVDAANDGRLVHISGPITPVGTPGDDTYGIRADKAVGLVRDVEMYQWVEHSESKTEKKLGGSEETVTTYNYSKEWRATDVDSNQFRQPDGHSNPQRAVDSARFTVETATVGAFTLPGNRVAALGSEKTIIPGADAIAAFRNAMGGQNVQVHNNLLYVGNDPRGPQVGDLKISYRRIDLAAASFIGAQRGDSLRPYKTSNGRELFLSAAGDSTADEMFESAKTENTVITWIVRAGGLLGMFIGFAFILSILGVAADLIPFVGSIVGFGTSLIAFAATAVLGPVVIAIGWIAYRPLLAIGIVAAGVAVAAGIVALRRRAARPAAPSPTGFGRPTA